MESNNKSILIEKLLENAVINGTVMEIIRNLDHSVKIRLERQPNLCKMCLSKDTPCDHSSVGVLFSGGLDCTIIAFLANKYVLKAQSIDLINIAFKKDDISSYEVPDRLTGRQSLEELKKLCPHRYGRNKNNLLEYMLVLRTSNVFYIFAGNGYSKK